jgi:predicted nucleic acid-binding protein
VILDTNALSALAEGDVDLLRVIEGQPDLAVPAIALGEYIYGIQQSRFRLRYERWLNANLSVLDLLAVGRGTAQPYAEIRRELKGAGQPIPSNDLWIAALAREYNLPIVSRDRHFQAVRGIRLVTW